MSDSSPKAASGIAAWNNSHSKNGALKTTHLCVASAAVSDPNGTAQDALDALLSAQKAHGVESAEFQTAFAAAPATASVSFLTVARKSAKFDPTADGGFTHQQSQAYLDAIDNNSSLFHAVVSMGSTSWKAKGLSEQDALTRIESPWPSDAKVDASVKKATQKFLVDISSTAKTLDGARTQTATLSVAIQNLSDTGDINLYFAFFTLSAIYQKPHIWSDDKQVQFTLSLTAGGSYSIDFLAGNWTADVVKSVVPSPFDVPSFDDWTGANSGTKS